MLRRRRCCCARRECRCGWKAAGIASFDEREEGLTDVFAGGGVVQDGGAVGGGDGGEDGLLGAEARMVSASSPVVRARGSW